MPEIPRRKRRDLLIEDHKGGKLQLSERKNRDDAQKL